MKTAEEVFNELNNTRAIKWEGLSDGGKWTRALEAMKLYAKEALEEAAKKAKMSDFFDQRTCESSYSVDERSILKVIDDLK